MALCENPYKDSRPRGHLSVSDKDGLVLCYPGATYLVNVSGTAIDIMVEDSDGVITMRGDTNQTREVLDMASRERVASRERDKLKAEITDLQGRNDWQVSKIRQLDQERDRLATELDEVRKMKDNSPCMQRALDAETRLGEARGDLQAMKASLDFSLETNERLKAEALLAQAKLAESRRTWVTDWDIANNRAIKAEAELTKVRIERDGARRDFLRATESHKWKYAADLEARIESVVVTLEEAMTSGGNWVHVNQALKIAKGKL